MKWDFILSGVGGQGILTIAYLLDHVSIKKGYYFKQAEVHGMSQRGGAVYSHLRISESPIYSDLIPEGKANFIVSMEPMEVARYTSMLHEKGMVITSNQFFKNISNYPEENLIMDYLYSLKNILIVDTKILASLAGNLKGANVSLVGCMIPFLPFEKSLFEEEIQDLFGKKGEKIVASNLSALEHGYQAGLKAQKLLQEGKTPQEILTLLSQK